MKEIVESFDFYDQTYLKSYNLDKAIQYQLNHYPMFRNH